MNIFLNILVALLCLFIGYIFGSIPTSVIIGKIFFHQDPRNYGSHNAGGTNAGRLWGKKVGFLIILIDMIKTIAPLWIVWAILSFAPINNGVPLCALGNNVNAIGINQEYLISWPAYYLVPLGCILGHCWPIFAKFSGGKGVACTMGISITSSWMICFIPAISYFIILKAKKYVSLASIIVPGIFSILSWIFSILMLCGVIPKDFWCFPMYGNTLTPGVFFSILLTFMWILVVIRHKANILRLISGKENKIKWMK